MEQQLRKTFCKYDMVCDSPTGVGLEMCHMPEFFSEKPKLETSQAHVHGFYEIVWFQQGGGVHYVDFNEYPVRPNTVFFISPGQVHSFDSSHNQEGVLIKFCGELLSDASDDGSTYLNYSVFNAFDTKPYCTVSDTEARKLQSIVSDMEDEMAESSLGHKEYLSSLVRMLLIRIERSCNSANVGAASCNRAAQKVFLAFREKLEGNYRTLHTVKEYAQEMGTTTKTLTQHISQCSSYTPLEIINNRIILEAERLLRYSDMMVKEIAYYLGFDDPSYFAKFFKRQTHWLPADYREGAD